MKQNRDDYEMELKILSYEELYGWTMDRIVGEIGKTNNCTFCGVFRRQALDRGAKMLNVNSIATGHNADDIAETVIMNILRGDTARLARCTHIKTVWKRLNVGLFCQWSDYRSKRLLWLFHIFFSISSGWRRRWSDCTGKTIEIHLRKRDRNVCAF